MQGKLAQLTVLLVEDNCDDEELALWAMKKTGITQITVARDGAAALAILLDAAISLPELVLLDLRLPKVDGVEVLRQLRADPRCQQLKVIVLTSSEDPRDMTECKNLDVIAFLTKPLSEKTLLSYLEPLPQLQVTKNGP